MINEIYKEVSKEIFYEKIGNLNVSLQITGNYPYTIYFKMKFGEIKGRIVDDSIGNSKYYVKSDM